LSALRNAPHLAGQPAKDSEKQLRPYGWVQRANEFMVVIAVMAVMAKPFSDIKRQT
jgi:cytochrome c553